VLIIVLFLPNFCNFLRNSGIQTSRTGMYLARLLRNFQKLWEASCWNIFTARCYASAVLAMALCLSVCLSVCPSQVGVLLKRLNAGSHKQHHTIAQGLKFSVDKDLREIRPGSPSAGAPNTGGVGQNRRLSTNSWLYLENGTR